MTVLVATAEEFLETINDLSSKEMVREFKKLSSEEKKKVNEELQKRVVTEKGFFNVEEKEYQGSFNLFILENFSKEGMHGTFIQWKNKGYKVRKGSEGIPLIQPIKKIIKEEDEENEEDKKERVVGFKIFYVFHEDQVENI